MRCTGNYVRGTYSRKDAAYRANIIEDVLENVTVGNLKKKVSEDVDLDVGTQEAEEIQSSVSEMQPTRKLPIVRDAAKIQEAGARKSTKGWEEEKMQTQKQENQARKLREGTRSEMQEKEEIQEEDASPGPARKCSSKDDVSGMRQGKLRGLWNRKKDAGLSPARIRCTPGKIVRRRDLGFKLGNSTVANLRKMFEPYSLTKGFTEGSSQLLPAKLYSGDTSSEDCVSQWEAAGQIVTRDILDLGFEAAQDWSEMPGEGCNKPMRMQER